MPVRARAISRTVCAATSVAVLGVAPGAGAAEGPWKVVKEVGTAGRAVAMRDVVAVGPRAAWAIGDDERAPVLWHHNGAAWKKVAVPLRAADNTHLTTVDATGPRDVWFFGRHGGRGLAARWDGARWRFHDLGVRTVLGAKVFGPKNVWVGAGAEIGHYDGRRWTFRAAGIDVRTVAASGPKDVWFAGQRGSGVAVVRWDGRSYRRQSLPAIPSPSAVRDIVAFRASNVWAVGSADGRPLALHWDGRRWSRTVLSRGDAFTSVTADGRGGLWAADSMWAATVHRYTRGRWSPTALPRSGTRFLSVGALANVRGTTRVWGAGTFLDEDPSNSATTGVIFSGSG
ncbi:hypothetical protein [Spirillospora sp. CA-294931]|uniref:hypothetical protein n=1 Tax=Spirillospora sp. CA-294931 TaxID=3240042 RepID=UPI003D931D47